MLKKIIGAIFGVLLLLVIIILIRTIDYTRSIPHTKALLGDSLDNAAIKHLSEAVQIKTVSMEDNAPVDTAAFLQFKSFLEKSYPLIHSRLQRIVINQFSYIYIWKGKQSVLPPYMLIAHSDVVPVEPTSEKLWKVPSFSGVIKDSAIWGRGTNDDKGCLVAIMEMAEKLLSQGFQPQRSIYFCFGHTEETSGLRGASAIVSWLDSARIKPGLVIDEGGFITEDNFKDLGRPIALLGVSEKGYATFELTVEKEGGHSSIPGHETAIDILAKALVNIRETQMPFSITLPTELMLKKIGPGLGVTTRMALANQWLFKRMLVSQFEQSNGTNATIHTTIVPTMLIAGIKDNVIPTTAKTVINCRILPGETSDNVTSFIKNAVKDERIKITLLQSSLAEPSFITPVESEAYKTVEAVCYQVMDDIVPAPFLMVGGTDARFYRKISTGVINFSPMLDPQGFHGVDERLSFSNLKRLIQFYELLVQK